MSFVVELSPTAEADLERLFDFLLDRAAVSEVLDRAQAAIDAIREAAQHQLTKTPFSFRKASRNPAQPGATRVDHSVRTHRIYRAV